MNARGISQSRKNADRICLVNKHSGVTGVLDWVAIVAYFHVGQGCRTGYVAEDSYGTIRMKSCAITRLKERWGREGGEGETGRG